MLLNVLTSGVMMKLLASVNSTVYK